MGASWLDLHDELAGVAFDCYRRADEGAGDLAAAAIPGSTTPEFGDRVPAHGMLCVEVFGGGGAGDVFDAQARVGYGAFSQQPGAFTELAKDALTDAKSLA